MPTVCVRIIPEPILAQHGDITTDVSDFIVRRLEALANFAWRLLAPNEPAANSDILVELTTKAPLFDEELLAEMVRRADRYSASVLAEGACPGTAPRSVVRVPVQDADAVKISWPRHFAYNCQLSLHKLKRLRIFLALRDRYSDLHAWPLNRLLAYLGSEAGTDFVLSYGGEARLERLSACPNCGSCDIDDLHTGNGQPVIGFLTRDSKYYCQCARCELVFLNPTVVEEDIAKLYDWYNLEMDLTTEQALSPDALAKRNAYGAHHRKLFAFLKGEALPSNPRVLDIGGGTGRFSAYIRQEFPDASVSLVDFHIANQKALKDRSVKINEANILRAQFAPASFDLITMWEVIEHFRFDRLPDVFDKIAKWLAPGGRLVLSTPNMSSKLCRAIDFWAWFAPHHLIVLSPNHIESLGQKAGLKLERIEADSVVIGEDRTDFDYAATAHSSIGARAEATVLRDLIQLNADNRDLLRRPEFATEMICILRKSG